MTSRAPHLHGPDAFSSLSGLGRRRKPQENGLDVALDTVEAVDRSNHFFSNEPLDRMEHRLDRRFAQVDERFKQVDEGGSEPTVITAAPFRELPAMSNEIGLASCIAEIK